MLDKTADSVLCTHAANGRDVGGKKQVDKRVVSLLL
jgi:hypothetical protein